MGFLLLAMLEKWHSSRELWGHCHRTQIRELGRAKEGHSISNECLRDLSLGRA
jgi:hypothetical protein